MSDSAPREHLVFYGTLMSGFASQEQLGARQQLRLLGPCTLSGRLFDMGEWPSLLLGGGLVHGELFEVLDAAVFAKLDPFENYDPRDHSRSSYIRRRVALVRPAVEAWVYVANEPVAPERRIGSGSWYEWVDAVASG